MKVNDKETFDRTGNQGFNLHLLSSDSTNEIDDFSVFKEYIEAHPDAHKAYDDIKREAVNCKKYKTCTIDYSKHKSQVVSDII